MNIIKFWQHFLITQFTRNFGGGGGSPPPSASSSTVTNTNIPEYAQPYVETMLGATQQQLFNTSKNADGTTQVTGIKPFTPYGLNQATGQAYSPQEMAGNMQVAQNAIAGFTPLQQQAQQGIAGLQMPGQIGDASNMAQQAGLAGLNMQYNPMSAGYNQVRGAQTRSAQMGYSPMAQAATGYGQNMQAATGSGQDMQAAQLGNTPEAQAAAMQAARLGNSPEAQAASMQAAQLSNTPLAQASQFGGPQNVNAQNVGTQDYTGGNVSKYMNPYLQSALDPQLAEVQRQYDITGTQQKSGAAKSGAFGGSREALMAAENQRNAGIAKNQIIGQGYNQAFQNAQQQFNTQQQANLQAQQANQGANLQAGLANQNMGYNTGLQNAQLQQQANLANQGLMGQYGLQQGQFGQAANQANQQAQMQANLANQALAGQYGLQQGQFGQAANQFNAGNQQQANLANQALAGQYGLQQGQFGQAANAANQAARNQFGMANLSNQQQANQANQAAQNQFGLANLSNQQQTGLANQALAGQYGMQQGQFNQAANLANQQSRNQANLANQQAQLQAQGQNINQQQFGANLGLQGLQQANQSAQTLGNLGGQQLQAQQGIYGLQGQVGAQQQQQQQNLINQAIQNYAVSQQYPQQQLAFMNAQLRGLPLQAGSTQMYQAAPNPVSQIAGLGATGLGAYGAMGGFKGKKGGIVKMAQGGVSVDLLSDEQLKKGQNSPFVAPEDKLAMMGRLQTNQRIEANPEAAKVINAGITDIPTGDLVPQQFNDGGIIAFAKGDVVPKGETMKKNADTMDYQDLIRQRLQDMDTAPDPFAGSEAARGVYGETIKKREELAPWMALMRGGLKAYGGTSPFANANIGAGAESGFEDYLKNQASTEAEKRYLLGQQTETEKNRYARKMTNLDTLIKAQGNIDAKTLGALYAKNVGAQTAATQQQANYIKAYNAFGNSLKNEMANIRAFYKQTYQMDMPEEEAYNLAQQRVMKNMPAEMKNMLGFNSNLKPITAEDFATISPSAGKPSAAPVVPPPPKGFK